MKRWVAGFLVTLVFASCEKDRQRVVPACDIQQVYEINPSKVTISSGIWGTVAFMEGNCMPTYAPSTSTCRTCPAKRTIRIYEYTHRSEATPQSYDGFYDHFNTRLLTEVTSDENGFFQAGIPEGRYTIVVVENGKLYTFGMDGQGGLSPLAFEGGLQKVNLTLTYKAAF